MRKYKLSKLFIEDLSKLILECRNGNGCHISDCTRCIICRVVTVNYGEASHNVVVNLEEDDINHIIKKTSITINEDNRFVITSRFTDGNKQYTEEAMRHLIPINICKL